MPYNFRVILFKVMTVAKWIFWIACVGLFSSFEKLYFIIPFALAVACGLLIRRYISRVPAPVIPAVCANAHV
jgi:hypothetical protein